MKQKLTTEKGFSVLEVVVAAAVVLGLVLIGWLMLNRSNANQTTKPSRQQAQSKSQNSSAEGSYLVIREWGIRFPLADGLQGDVYYAPDKQDANTMIIDSKSFPMGSECTSFSLTRTAEPVNNPVDPEGFSSSSIKKIGDYYYSRVTGVIACSDEKDIQTRAVELQRQLYALTASIEAVQ